jgi:hypothetical protein
MDKEEVFAVHIDFDKVKIQLLEGTITLPDAVGFLVESVMNAVDNHATFKYTIQAAEKQLLVHDSFNP